MGTITKARRVHNNSTRKSQNDTKPKKNIDENNLTRKTREKNSGEDSREIA